MSIALHETTDQATRADEALAVSWLNFRIGQLEIAQEDRELRLGKSIENEELGKMIGLRNAIQWGEVMMLDNPADYNGIVAECAGLERERQEQAADDAATWSGSILVQAAS